MPIMIDSLSSVSPTITLAELYESQKHYLAAYAIYRYLSLKNRNHDFSDKIQTLKAKAFTDEEKTDHPELLESVFDEQDYAELGILAPQKYFSIQETIDALLDKETNELDMIETQEEHLYSEIEDQISTEWQQILSSERDEKTKEKAKSISLDKIDWSKIKLSDFIGFLVGLKCDDKTLDKLRLSEIMEIFLSHYSEKDSDEEK